MMRGSLPNGRERKAKPEVTSEGHRRDTSRRLTFRRRIMRRREAFRSTSSCRLTHIPEMQPRLIIFLFLLRTYARNHLCVTRFLRLYRTFPDECSNRREQMYAKNPCRCTMHLSYDITRHSFRRPRSLNASFALQTDLLE